MLAVLALNLALRIAAGGYGAVLAARSRDWRLAAFAFAVLISGAKVIVQIVRRGPLDGWWTRIDVTHGLDLVTGMACLLAAVAARGVLVREERERSRQAARSEAQARRFAEIRDDGVWTLDLEGKTTYINRALAHLLGRSPGEMLGTSWLDVLPLDLHAEAQECLADLSLRSANLDPVLVHNVDGSPRFVRMHLSLLEDVAADSPGCLVHAVDITASTLQGFVRSSRQPMLDEIAAGSSPLEVLALMINVVEYRLPGYSMEADLSLENAITQRTTLAAGRWLEPLASSTGQPLGHIEIRLPMQRTAHSEELALSLACGQLGGLMVERCQTRTAFNRTRRLLEATLEESQAGILVVGALDQTIELANAAARRLIYPGGQSPGALIGRRLSDHYADHIQRSPDGQAIAAADMPLMRSLQLGETCHDVPIIVERAGQDPVWILVNTTPLLGADGSIEAAVAVFLDVTGREQANRTREQLVQQLAAQTGELEQVFRATSHDLRSPLVNIDGFSEEIRIGLAELRGLLEPTDLGDKRQAVQRLLNVDLPDALRFVQSSTAKMERLLRALSVLSAMDSSALQLQPVNVAALMQRILDEFSYPVQSLAADLRILDLPECMGMEDELAQVFSNLIDNAIKYKSPERALQITVAGERNGTFVEYRVTDNGIGVAPRHHKKIFEAFRRLDPNGPVEGEGIGLSILARIVARHGGRAGVASAPGDGSTFWVRLPACDVASHAAAQPPVYDNAGSDAVASDPASNSEGP